MVMLTLVRYNNNCISVSLTTTDNTTSNINKLQDQTNIDPLACLNVDKNKKYDIKVGDMSAIGMFGDMASDPNFATLDSYRLIMDQNNKVIGTLKSSLMVSVDKKTINVNFSLTMAGKTYMLTKCSGSETCLLKNLNEQPKVTISPQPTQTFNFSSGKYMKESYAYIPKTSVVRKNAF
jgi:hypothetical protein